MKKIVLWTIAIIGLAAFQFSREHRRDLHRSELEYVVAKDPTDSSQKCILGAWHGTKGMSPRFIEKIDPIFENDLPIGTPVLAFKKDCKECATKIWTTLYIEDNRSWESRSVPYKIIARPIPDGTDV